MNKLYKILMFMFALFIEFTVSYTFGLLVSSFCMSIAVVVTKFISEYALSFISNNYLVLWLLTAVIPSFIMWILLLKHVSKDMHSTM